MTKYRHKTRQTCLLRHTTSMPVPLLFTVRHITYDRHNNNPSSTSSPYKLFKRTLTNAQCCLECIFKFNFIWRFCMLLWIIYLSSWLINSLWSYEMPINSPHSPVLNARGSISDTDTANFLISSRKTFEYISMADLETQYAPKNSNGMRPVSS